ncbi:Salivary acidic proline-rich phosphoprotein 1/2 [Rhizoctonia solani]
MTKANKPPGRAALERLSRRHNIIEFGRESDDEKFGATDIIGNNGTNSQIKETQGRQALLAERKRLPIWTGRRALVQAVKENDTLIVLGETGSGKTTRESKANKLFHTISSSCAIEVPQFLLGSGIAGNGMIAVTQPRKVAAISLANRVSIEHGTPVGETVGYAVRFDEKAGPNTRIKYLTDGMLVRELLLDPSLSRYSVIIVDEAHERTLRTDMLLGSLKRIQYDRNVGMGGEKANIKGKEKAISRDVSPLKIIVMSATLDAERFSQFFNRARIVYVKGRQHPVKLMYLKDNTSDYLDSALRTLFQIHINQPPGDILVFLAGQEDIETLEKAIQVYCNKPLTKPILVYPMYAALPSHQQSRIFQPPPKGSRKVILSTNIAETSITIPGVRYVIDSGMCKEKGYQSRNAGTGPESGKVTEEKAYGSLDETSLPEIQRCNLAFAALQLKCLQQDLSTTDLIDAPPSDAIATSLISLFGLNALDSTGHITPLGRKLAGFPLDPPFGRALIASEELGCLLDVIDILSILSASSKVMLDPPSEQREIALEARQKFMHRSGDHLTLLNILRAYLDALREALSIRSQLISTCKHMNMDATQKPGNASDSILKSLLAGLFMNTALLQPDGGYKQIVGQQVLYGGVGTSSCADLLEIR